MRGGFGNGGNASSCDEQPCQETRDANRETANRGADEARDRVQACLTLIIRSRQRNRSYSASIRMRFSHESPRRA
jgi:hypothetical protein